MYTTVHCSACRQPVKLPNTSLGLAVQCPRCAHLFPAVADPAPPPGPVEILDTGAAPAVLAPVARTDPPASVPAPAQAPLPDPGPRRPVWPWALGGAAVACALVVGLILGRDGQGWHAEPEVTWHPLRFTVGEDVCEIALPGEPTQRRADHAPQDGYTQYVVARPGWRLFFALGFGDVQDPPNRPRPPAEWYRTAVDGLLKAEGGGTVLGEAPVQAGAYHGIEYRLHSPRRGLVVARCFAVRQRLFLLLAGGPAASPGHPDLQKFFASFRVNPTRLADARPGPQGGPPVPPPPPAPPKQPPGVPSLPPPWPKDALSEEVRRLLLSAVVQVLADYPDQSFVGSGVVVYAEPWSRPGKDFGPEPPGAMLVLTGKRLAVGAARLRVRPCLNGQIQEALQAEVVAADPDRDLAVLRVAANPRAPLTPARLDLDQLGKPRADTPFVLVAVPRGAELDLKAILGQVTLTDVQPAAARVVGGLESGLVGAPVVEKEHGHLIGVVVGDPADPQASQVIPAAEVMRLLAGRLLGDPTFTVFEEKGFDGVRVKAEVPLLDPLHRLGRVFVRLGPAADGLALQADDRGSFPPLPRATEHSLALTRDGVATVSCYVAEGDLLQGRMMGQVGASAGPFLRAPVALRVGQNLRRYPYPAPPEAPPQPPVHPGERYALLGHPDGGVTSVAFSADGQTLITAGAPRADGEGLLRYWEAATGKAAPGQRPLPVAGPVALAPGRRFFAGLIAPQTVEVFRWPSEQVPEERRFPCTAAAPPCVFSPDGEALLAARGDEVVLYRLASRHPVWRCPLGAQVRAVAVTAQGPHFAAATAQEVKVGRLDSGAVVTTFAGHQALVGRVAFTPDGAEAFSADAAGVVKRWDTASAVEKASLPAGAGDGPPALAVAPDGRWLATGGTDGAVRLWDARTGQPGREMALAAGVPVRDLAFSPDGRLLAAGAANGLIKVWEVPAAEAPPVARDKVPQPRPPAEPKAVAIPRAEEGHYRFGQPPAGQGKLQLARLATVNAAADVVPDLIWLNQGVSFLMADRTGLVQRVSLRDLTEERRIALGQECSGLALAADGLVAALPKLGEAWLLDPMTLDVRERISLPGLVRVTAAPATSLAVALCRPNGSEILQVIDLKHAEVVASQDLKAMQNPQRLGLLDPTLTPDGRHLFTRSATMLHRWQVSDKGVIHRESSFPLLKEGPGLIQVTGDGRMVGLVAPQGNLRGIPDHPDPGERGTYLFVAGQIRKPPVSLSNTTGAFASDRGGRFYSLSDTGLLQVYNARGEKFGERPAFSEPVVPVRQILLHPEGSRMLILTGKTLALAVLGE